MNYNKDIKENNGTWEWLYSEKEYEDGETYDLHWLLNKYSGEIKMVITKRKEVIDDKKERIFRG